MSRLIWQPCGLLITIPPTPRDGTGSAMSDVPVAPSKVRTNATRVEPPVAGSAGGLSAPH